ncbi:hypothetical protein [Commensalibacter communis]|uniref:hypothetical protein n=1 Tax=Commensalibacter communis TaxID=2972786 RepID=UPI00232C486F|nr:hypothetical protein [Commensalibacter communis]
MGFLIYSWSSETFEDHLYNTIRPECFQQPTCKISLHELTPFVWDQAYIFPRGDAYSNQAIQKVTGVSGDFQRINTLAIFMYHHRLVKFVFFDFVEYDDNFRADPPNDHYFDVAFYVDTGILRQMNNTGRIKNFGAFKRPDYLEMTSKNDFFYVSCHYQSRPFYGEWKECLMVPADKTQLRWFDRSKSEK